MSTIAESESAEPVEEFGLPGPEVYEEANRRYWATREAASIGDWPRTCLLTTEQPSQAGLPSIASPNANVNEVNPVEFDQEV